MSVPIPNPGSREARVQGCSCPVIDNAYGHGYLSGIKDENDQVIFVINDDCLVHGRVTEERA